MSNTIPLHPQGVNAEVIALIQTLQKTNQRLMTLTGGELDSFADAGGRTFLLQHAQEDVALFEAAKQAAILNALPAHIALLDPEGQIISVNEAWRQFAISNGLRTPQQGLGHNYLAACDKATGDKSAEAHQAAAGIRAILAGTAKTFSLEYPCHGPAGRSWYQLSVSPLPGDPPRGAVVMHVNFTAERNAEEALRTSESRFRQMAENVDEVFFLMDIARHRMLYVSPAYETIWGYSCASLYENLDSWIDLIHADDRAATEDLFIKGIAAGKFEMAYRTVRPDGSLRWIDVNAFPVRDDSGKTVRIAGVAKDVSERKHAEMKIHRNEQRYRSLVEATADIVWDTPASGEFETEQLGWSAFTGQSFEELRGLGWMNAIHPDDQMETTRLWALALANRAVYEVEHRVLARDHTWRNMLARAVPIFSEDGELWQWIGVHMDITERKKAETRINT
jgi:PAS domain S-box-containing protein